MSAIEPVLQHLAADRANALERAKQLLAIPSVSADPACRHHVQAAADWVAGALREAGLLAEVRPTAGQPAVLARTPADAAPADAPRVLFYGHYDVQPADPVELWDSPPFQPTIREGKLYARGAADDKGQVVTFIEALRAWRSVHGELPVHVTAFIEGEEECGSENLHAFVEAHKAELANHDFVLIADTSMWDRHTPAITYGLRGTLYFDVQLHGPKRDLHSGLYGGTLANPANVLTEVLGRLLNADRRVTIPGFYNDVAPIDDAERIRWADLNFDDQRFLRDVGGSPLGEAGYSTLERRWGRPTCDINGLYGGYGGPGMKTIIPSFAGAKVSFRMVPNQSPAKIAQQFRTWLESQDVHGCRWKIEQLHATEPVVVNTDSPWFAAAARACERIVGRRPVMIREGAAIPVVSDFKKTLGLDSLLLGFGREDDCIHSPNEKFDLECFDYGCRTFATLLGELASCRSTQ